MTPLDAFDRAAATVLDLVANIRDDQWGRPTACADWDVRAVVNHLAQGNAKVAAWAGEGPVPEDGDHLGDDPKSAFAESVRKARDVLATPGLFERQVTTPLGTAPGVFLVHMRVTEHLVHGWDIADATGQPADLPPDLVENALAQVKSHLGGAPRSPGGPFGPEQEAAPGASAADRLAAFLGRNAVNG